MRHSPKSMRTSSRKSLQNNAVTLGVPECGLTVRQVPAVGTYTARISTMSERRVFNVFCSMYASRGLTMDESPGFHTQSYDRDYHDNLVPSPDGENANGNEA